MKSQVQTRNSKVRDSGNCKLKTIKCTAEKQQIAEHSRGLEESGWRKECGLHTITNNAD